MTRWSPPPSLVTEADEGLELLEECCNSSHYESSKVVRWADGETGCGKNKDGELILWRIVIGFVLTFVSTAQHI